MLRILGVYAFYAGTLNFAGEMNLVGFTMLFPGLVPNPTTSTYLLIALTLTVYAYIAAMKSILNR